MIPALTAFGTTGPRALLAALEGLDVRAHLAEAGVPAAGVDRLVHRLRPDLLRST